VRLSDTGRKVVDDYWRAMEELRESAARWQPQNAALVPAT
jgi:hypothetical protein